MLHTTFARAKEAGACASSYKKMAKALGGVKKYGLDTPIPLSKKSKKQRMSELRAQGFSEGEAFERWEEEDAADGEVATVGILEVCGLEDALWALRIVIEPADKEIRLFACDCAERVLPLFETKYPEDKRPRQAIETARKFARGEATQIEMDAAGAAAWAARAAVGGAAGGAPWGAAWGAACAACAPWDAAWGAAGAAEKEWQRIRFMKLLTQNYSNPEGGRK